MPIKLAFLRFLPPPKHEFVLERKHGFRIQTSSQNCKCVLQLTEQIRNRFREKNLVVVVINSAWSRIVNDIPITLRCTGSTDSIGLLLLP